MTSWVSGLWYVRSGAPATVLVLIMLLVCYFFPDRQVDVSAVYDQPYRPAGIMEICGVILASILPAMTAPAFDGRERAGARMPRLIHTGITLFTLALPLTTLPVWYAAVLGQGSHPNLPVLGMVGNLVAVGALSWALCLCWGRWASVVLTPAAYCSFVVAQQVWPDTVLTTEFASGSDWHTNWPLVGVLVVALGLLAWSRHDVPRGEG